MPAVRLERPGHAARRAGSSGLSSSSVPIAQTQFTARIATSIGFAQLMPAPVGFASSQRELPLELVRERLVVVKPRRAGEREQVVPAAQLPRHLRVARVVEAGDTTSR